MLRFITALIIIPILDSPWILYNGTALFDKIQGSPVKFSLLPAGVVYVALAYLLTQFTSAWDAFKGGAAVYAVYDFTNLAVFKNYTLAFAVQDTLWGGILFATAFTLLELILNK